MDFSRPEYWSGQSFPSLGGLPNPGIEPRSPTLQADSLPAEPPGKPRLSVLNANLQIVSRDANNFHLIEKITAKVTVVLPYKTLTSFVCNLANLL